MMKIQEHTPPLAVRKAPTWQDYVVDSGLAFVGAMLVTGIIYMLALYPRIPNISFVYLLVVLALASTRGLYPAVLASFVAFLSFDFFLVQPLYTFTINKVDEWLALFVFLVVAIITGQLTNAFRQRAQEANRRERETRILYELVRATNSEEDLPGQLAIVARTAADIFAPWGVTDCAILLPGTGQRLEVEASAPLPAEKVHLSADEEATAAWVLAHGQAVDFHDVALAPGASVGYAPRAIVRSSSAVARPLRQFTRLLSLKAGHNAVGILRLSIEDDPQHFTSEKGLGLDLDHSDPRTTFFWTFLDQATSLIERTRLRQEALQVELLRQTDALRAALLSSVSHDLRTPLSSIKAAASSLLQEDVDWDEEARHSFALAIEQEADRLNRLVANLLDMSRIEGGALKPEKEWYPLDELIYSVLARMQPRLQARAVTTSLPDDLPPVEIDYLYMDQVVTNLIENAIRYTPAGSPIEMGAEIKQGQMFVSIADRGPGIPPADMERIFDKFYRVSAGPRGVARSMGTGLGLAVCRGLIEAHGGRIWAESRTGGGAVFRFTLPLGRTEGMQHA
ncbi:MAG: ATP-binding protein [Ktedonobacteraceae bacterium]